MIILFGMPIAQVLIFGFTITNEISDTHIAILDQSKDHVTLELTNKIVSSGYFLLYDNINAYDEIDAHFREGKIKEVIIFENNFARNLEKDLNARVRIITDASDPNMANIILNYTMGIIRNYQMEKFGDISLPIDINVETKMLYNPELKGVFMFVPGTITVLLMLISAMMTSISIAREKELGTMEVLMVSPIKPIQIIIGKVIPYIILSFINAGVIIVMGFFVFDLPVRGSLVLLLAESLLFISLALSLGILISTVSESQQVAMFISMFALMLPTILLSGFIYPIENMPIILQIISNLMPPKWFITIIKDIMIKGEGLRLVWQETLILFGMMVFFLLVAVKRFKIRLE